MTISHDRHHLDCDYQWVPDHPQPHDWPIDEWLLGFAFYATLLMLVCLVGQVVIRILS